MYFDYVLSWVGKFHRRNVLSRITNLLSGLDAGLDGRDHSRKPVENTSAC